MDQLAASTVPVSSFRFPPTYTNMQLRKFIKKTIQKYNYWKCSVISDTFFLLANRSIDPNLRTIATSYIVHYDYKEARFFFHYLTQRLDWGIRPFNSLSAMSPKRCHPFFLPSKTPKRSNLLLQWALFQALDNVTESKVVMAEARQLLDFFMRKNFINKFGESSMHIMKVRQMHHRGWTWLKFTSRSVFSLLAWLTRFRRTRPIQRGCWPFSSTIVEFQVILDSAAKSV